jgi:hypothetical protein
MATELDAGGSKGEDDHGQEHFHLWHPFHYCVFPIIKIIKPVNSALILFVIKGNHIMKETGHRYERWQKLWDYHRDLE